ncbi:adenine-specific DNA-methyltransferase [Prevotellaceae bacterium HUN156]|nr:adenine-specific DNA-methyltransferase [Prevotellaceae bacterium HUN156]
MAMNYYDKFVAKLQEIFMMDHAELDFGIYRIMNQKRDEINHFLQVDLLPQVKQALQGDGADTRNIRKRMAEIEQQLGTDIDSLPQSIPMVAEYHKLKNQLAQGGSAEDMESEVFSHLVTFFSRYYDGGDFLSKRRYKDNTYAIPYNGEEVKLHWANSDQYYIKTSEYFRDYTFVLPTSRKKVHFVLKDASTEQNNNRAANNMERRFALWEPENEGEQVIEVTADGELNIYFTYELMPKATKQDALRAEAFETVKPLIPAEYEEMLTTKAPTQKEPNRTLLEQHLTDYTAKNSFDYFIHKDLGGFLSRELDFYIKNEVLHIDDLDPQHINNQLSIVKAIKQVGQKIIQMLAQLENFQKKLWLKKKFVVQSDYCITLDRVPEKLYPEIIANDEQRKEWVRLFAIDEIKGDLTTEGYSEPLTIEFLKQNQFLVLDTAFFDAKFKHQLVKSMENIDEQTNGLLINSENYQALKFLKEKYSKKIKCVYIDPPYNTGDDDFLYKDALIESSWLSLIYNRLEETTSFFKDGGTFSASIDINEVAHLTELLDVLLGKENRKANITIRRASISGAKVINPGPVNISENVIFYNNGISKWQPYNAYRERNYDSRYNSMIINPDANYQQWQFCSVLDAFAESKGIQKSKLKRELGESYENELLKFVIANAKNIIRWASLDEDSVGNEAAELKRLSRAEPNKTFFLPREDANDYYIKNGNAILFYKDRLRWMGDGLVPVEQISDIWDDVLPNDLHNEGGVQLKKGKKPEKLINRIFEATTKEGEMVLDYFAGSATSGAVALKSNRKFINIEANEYFDDIPLRRLKNTLHGDKSGVSNLYNWKGGGCFKYIRLEQYEDTLNNLEIKKQELEFQPKEFQESYMLSYLLDTETRDSLLNLKWFENPFEMTLKTTKDNELVETKVDMVETFNYLIGLNVETEDWYQDDNICVVQGKTHREGLKTLVIWRNRNTVDNEKLCAFFDKMDFRTRDTEFDLIYVNGDNTLPNLKRDEDHWKVVLTEEEFAKRMFEEN